MKSLILHCREFGSKFDSLSSRPNGIEPERIENTDWEIEKCIPVLITVEIGDNLEVVSDNLAEEIKKTSKDLGEEKVVLVPFAHLSNKLAHYSEGKEFFDLLEEKLSSLDITRVHFGSHKSLLLDVIGHAGNIRFREF